MKRVSLLQKQARGEREGALTGASFGIPSPFRISVKIRRAPVFRPVEKRAIVSSWMALKMRSVNYEKEV
jgi:hypothetical protein